MATIDIVIVNWNSGPQLLRCIQSIMESDGMESINKIIIVDNGSTDHSHRLEGLEFAKVIVLENDFNLGFASACNQGARVGNSEYILFLNPDTILAPGTLQTTLQWMELEEHKPYAIVGVQLTNQDGNISRSCCRLPSFRDFITKVFGMQSLFRGLKGYQMLEWDHSSSQEVGHVMGSYYFVRRSTFHSLHGFDERFFMYLEDLDFSKRAAMNGLRTYYLSEARAFHKGGGSSEQVKARRLFYSLSSRILFVRKHCKTFHALLITLGTLIIEPFIRIIGAIISMSLKRAIETIHGFLLLWKSLPQICSDRSIQRIKSRR